MDKYSVKLLSRAFHDLDRIYAYIAGTLLEPGTAEHLLDTLEEAVFSLEKLPRRGAPRKKGVFTNRGYRQLFINNFIVVYRVDENKKQVVIVRIDFQLSQYLHQSLTSVHHNSVSSL